ncbi:M3 family metallopeptidase [Roseateles saccharophilus]|uniref:oligopeptidase A n=1 Tax=Roseateles saccharophilus TaxID=304 RepID=A0A4R3UGC4_ROSSA|nr:M3 family metallopeptidase [Roseateles saccharophilus]MDG0834424.1 M3 family peptidase [Roseateles saccharophilus]TCU89864.1 oligopeptidase A [Roseateles saccharophilus]
MTNPLLSTAALPDFAAIRPEHVQPAIHQLLAAAQAALDEAVKPETPADYDALSRILDTATERMGAAWGAVGHLNAVADTPALREAYNAMLPAVTEFSTAMGANEALFAKYKAVMSAQGEALSAPRRQLLKHAIRDFVLSGAELQGTARERYAAIQERSAELQQQFSEHVLDATDGWHIIASAEELAGVPQDVLDATRLDDGGYKITLHFPVYLPVMQYAENRALRETLYRAYVTRASEQGKPEWDNTAAMREIVALRQEEAQLLGYTSFAEVSLAPKMASTPAEVMHFLRDLAGRARPFAEKDLAELRDFAKGAALESWDVSYWSEKLKEARYAFSDQTVKQYFTAPKVVAGLFSIIERLFDVSITEASTPVWNDTVKFYELRRSGKPIAQFYLDLCARPGKRPGAWMDDVRSRWLRPSGEQQLPVAQLVCNFASPVGAKPALLTHDDVITLFHEFGHGLHHMLTQVNDLGVSGISGVEWDAVELPSQFMENFCWEWDVLQQLSGHVDSGAPLPRELFEKMLAAKNFQSGLMTLRQIEFALFDMRLHGEPGSEADVQKLLDEVRDEVAVLIPPAFNRFQHSFSHIFAGGYAAGYYSYKWAELLSADAWSAFEEEGVFNAATGRRFLHEVLEQGGARDAIDNFKAFRGREPRIDALLRHQGMS